jgi:hypothetical protein
MSKATPAFKRHQAHVIYKLKDGARVPGTTTITGLLDKPALVGWANNLGLQGISSHDYVDSMAGVGTLAHAMCVAMLTGDLTEDLDEYAPIEVRLARNSAAKFQVWLDEHEFKPIFIEQPLVSEEHRFGGTVDMYGMLDGMYALVDLKTGKAIYSEMVYQLAAYRQLLIEHGYTVDNVRIVRIGRDESEGFEERIFGNLDKAWQVFWHLRQIYDLRKGV